MRLQFLSIAFENFKGLRDYLITFDEGVNSFYGANETGKSTIADGISWVLFGKDSHDNQNFGIKTYDKNREIIPHLKHSVTLTLTIDGEQHKLKRELSEKWSKDGNNLIGNTTLYTVDGMDYTAKDYQAFIGNIIDEGTFKAVTNPTYFLNLHWQEQRKVLTNLAGELKNEDITGGDTKFNELLGLLQRQDLESIIKHIHFQVKEVEDKLKIIPVRLKEQNKALPKKQNWDKVYLDLEAAKKERKQTEGELMEVKRGNGESVHKESLRQHIDWLQKKVDEIAGVLRQKSNNLQNDHDARLRSARKSFEDANDTFNSLGDKINRFNTFIRATNDSIAQLELDKKKIQEEWNANKEKKAPDLPGDVSVCPACGQPLPADQLKEKIHEIQENFNKHRAEEAKVIRAKFTDVKNQLLKANEDLASYEKELADTRRQQEDYRHVVVETQKKYTDLQKEKVSTLDELLSSDEEYKKAVDSITTTKDELSKTPEAGVDESLVKELEDKLTEINSTVSSLTEAYSSKAYYDKITDNIKEINEEKKKLDEQFASLCEQQDIANTFQASHDNLLESKVNDMFSYVKFRMFKRLVNGSKEPYCECFRIKDGVPYYDLNSAGKLNAGIDIINTFQKHYDIYAPVVIDNAEAVNKILDSSCQQIRLYVSEDKTLVKRGRAEGDLFAQ